MSRVPTVSDEAIYDAARNVMMKRGPDAFTLAEVAGEVGLSRAAIILRFKSTHALKVSLLEKMVEQFESAIDKLPKQPGAENLVRVAAFIGSILPPRESLTFFFSTYSRNMQDQDLVQLEIRRGMALREAIARVMPKTVLSKEASVHSFNAFMGGTILDWQARTEVDAQTYLVARAREWLKLAGLDKVNTRRRKPAVEGATRTGTSGNKS